MQGHFALSVVLGTKQKVGRYVSFNTDIWSIFISLGCDLAVDFYCHSESKYFFTGIGMQ